MSLSLGIFESKLCFCLPCDITIMLKFVVHTQGFCVGSNQHKMASCLWEVALFVYWGWRNFFFKYWGLKRYFSSFFWKAKQKQQQIVWEGENKFFFPLPTYLWKQQWNLCAWPNLRKGQEKRKYHQGDKKGFIGAILRGVGKKKNSKKNWKHLFFWTTNLEQ